MALHGHTRIELTDVNTNEVQILEDDNLVTNGIVELLSQTGEMPNEVYEHLYSGNSFSDEYNHIDVLTGGLLIYDKAIPESEGQLWPPIESTMVGQGTVDTVYSGTNLKAGSYIAAESGISADGHSYTHTWTFDTSQANGNIEAVCLTTASGGLIGTGNDDSNLDSDNWMSKGDSTTNQTFKNFVSKETTIFWEAFSSTDCRQYSYAPFEMMYIDKDNNCFYGLDYVNSPAFIHSSTNGYGATITQDIINASILKNHYFYLNKYEFASTDDFSLFKPNLNAPSSSLKIEYKMDSTAPSTVEVKQKSRLISSTMIELPQLADIITDTMATLGSGYYYHWDFSCDRGYIYLHVVIHKNSTIALETPFMYIWQIDVAQQQITNFKTIKNFFSESLSFSRSYNPSSSYYGDMLHPMRNNDQNCWFSVAYATNNSVLVMGNNGYILNYADETDIQAYKIYDSSNPLPNGFLNCRYFSSASFVNGNYILWQGINNISRNISKYIVTINENTGEIKYLHTELARYLVYSACGKYRDISNSYMRSILPIYSTDQSPVSFVLNYFAYGSSSSPYRYWGTLASVLFTLPSLLITINNLPEKITKKNTQTMKVIYTLREDV